MNEIHGLNHTDLSRLSGQLCRGHFSPIHGSVFYQYLKTTISE